MDRRDLGRWGEEQAAGYLRRRGWRIRERNYACRMGEIDLIAEKRDTIAFVEVKLRKSAAFAQAREFVTRAKQERIRTTAALWLAENETDKAVRFDVVEIYAPEGERTLWPRIEHLENAFD